MGWEHTVKQKFQYCWQSLHTTIAQVAQATQHVFSSNVKSLKDNTSYLLQGFSQPLHLLRVAKTVSSAKTLQQIYRQASFQNLVYYGGSVFAFENFIKPIMYSLPGADLPGVNEVLNVASTVVFLNVAIKMCVSNTAYGLNANTTAAKLIEPSQTIVGCKKCDHIKFVKANLSSGFYFAGNIAIAKLISYVPVVGRYSSGFLNTLAYGQCLVEYRYAPLGMCTPHREELFQSNNAFCFGLGLSLYASTYLLNQLINHLTNYLYRSVNYQGEMAENGFVYDALFSLMFIHFIVVSLTQTEPLPGTKLGVNIFRYPRLVINYIMRDAFDDAIARLTNPEKRDNFLKHWHKIVKAEPVKLLSRALISDDLKSLERLVEIPAIRMLLDLNQKAIVDGLQTVHKARGYPLWLSDYTPNFIASKSTLTIINLLNSRGWDQTSQFIRRVIDISVRSKAVSEEIYAIHNESPNLIETHVQQPRLSLPNPVAATIELIEDDQAKAPAEVVDELKTAATIEQDLKEVDFHYFEPQEVMARAVAAEDAKKAAKEVESPKTMSVSPHSYFKVSEEPTSPTLTQRSAGVTLVPRAKHKGFGLNTFFKPLAKTSKTLKKLNPLNFLGATKYYPSH